MRSDAVRWGVCATLVAAAHAWALFALAKPDLNVESDAGSPVVTLDLSPVSAAPAPPDEPQPDAEPDAQAAQAQPVAEPPPAPEPRPSPPPTPEAAPMLSVRQPAPPPTPEPHPAQAVNQPEPPPPEPVPAQAVAEPGPPPPAPQQTADVAPPPPASPPVQKEAPTIVDLAPPPPPRQPPITKPPTTADLPPQPLSPPPSAPSVAAMTTADIASAPAEAPGREETVSPAALRTWRQALVAQIERHKQFPISARGQSGASSVAFSIDRDGHLTDVRLVASSGSADLDQASLDLIRRAQPFPAPPAGLGAKELTFVTPIRYLPPSAR